MTQILESESNSESATNQLNRIDLMVSDSNDQRIIIEVQNEREVDFLERLAYGVSKVIVENLDQDRCYRNISKVISISAFTGCVT